MQDFLLEIGCEEIPARFVADGIDQLAEKVANLLKAERISFQKIESFATPRRLAVRVLNIAEKQENKTEEVRGPAARIAQTPDGNWSRAAEGFARKNGVAVDQLQLKEYKGEMYVFAVRQENGRSTYDVIAEKLPSLIASLTFPVTMRWGTRKERFIRPVRWLLALLGEEVIPVEWAGVRAQRTTLGHRFLGKEIALNNPGEYEEALLAQYVIVRPEERKRQIVEQIKALEEEKGWKVPIDEGLLEEVTYLVEYPTVLFGSFAEKYLQLPKQVLITTMREHQRYFPVEDKQGALLPYFLTVRNGNHHKGELVRKGNEKVLSARLADAEFFYLEDQKQSIEHYVRKLDKIVFHEELGTVGDRLRRVAKLAELIAQKMPLNSEEKSDLSRAAQIAKFDLATQMIGEFPELEGYMGKIYAEIAGEKEEVAKVIEEHYLPRQAGDPLPDQRISCILSLSDKVDQIAASFGIGIQPTGSQDPYGLRRKAAGVTQIYLHSAESMLGLKEVLHLSLNLLEEENLLKKAKEELLKELLEFFRIRLKAVLKDHLRYDILDAVLQSGISQPALTKAKGEVLMNEIKRSSFKEEVEAFTRVANLAKNATIKEIVPELFQEEAEHHLYETYQTAKAQYQVAVEKEEPSQMYQALSAMAPEIHQFFDQVLVMVEEEKIRNNRLALLEGITQLTSQFAKFDQIVFPTE